MKLMAIILTVLLYTGTAHAQQTDILTEANIRAYITELEESYKLPYEQHVEFLKRTTHQNFTANVVGTLIVPGKLPIKQKPVTLSRDDVLTSAKGVYDSFKIAKLKSMIKDTKISTDQKSAIVKSQMDISDQQAVLDNQSGAIPADSVSNCEDELVYTKGLGVQILKSECETEMTLKVKQE